MTKGRAVIRPKTLRGFRTIRGLTQAELAARATEAAQSTEEGGQVSESLIALIETGRRQTSARNAKAIAVALGIELEALAEITQAETPAEEVPA